MKKETKNYRIANKDFMRKLANDPDIMALDKGVFYRVLAKGSGEICPAVNDVVSVHYRGTLIDGREFDSTIGQYPEAFRVRDVIEGWQVALVQMHVGDKWMIYIPKDMGYGDKKIDKIPGGSTLVFEVELLAIN